ncbi:hypothetical protein OUZ56_032702 [Daphnia magna]|uniref:Uncharacterized protein n=1 Tax=Daphnia magna TaxID=35525 RepID=A0ABQ9ZWU6_9CRUS|nr:hypothetical protein OUZ56_032702 [Daphnia magna]
MRDYQKDEMKGADYVKLKTPFQRRRDPWISQNVRLYMVSHRNAEDLRNFLSKARYFTEPDLTALVENAVALLEEGQQEDQPEGTVPPIIQARRRRYLAGTPRPLTPLIEGVADDSVNLVDPFEPTATPAAPTEQSGLLNITGMDILDESDNHPAPTVRGHLGRRLPASLSPGGDFIVPASRRPRLNRNAATTRQSTRGRSVGVAGVEPMGSQCRVASDGVGRVNPRVAGVEGSRGRHPALIQWISSN